jgi:DNA-directed RNA polymerase delta subunit
MQQNDSILDKIISSKQASLMSDFSPKDIVEIVLKPLTEREREVVFLRHGLDLKGKKTLENIGNKFNITRERVRQIENSALKKIKATPEVSGILEPVEAVFNQTLEQFGGIMPEELLLDEVLTVVGSEEDNKIFTSFILTQLLNERFHFIDETDDYYPAWKLPAFSLDNLEEVLGLIYKIVEETKEPIQLKDLLNILQNKYNDHTHKSFFKEPILTSFLTISKKIENNPFNEWGLVDWDLITLKRISDKVYLVLKKETKPLHFTEIANKINELGFDNKKANPATIHNELILDSKYVLVGRGIYALKEWGYEPGIVSEVVAEVLRNSKKPLTRDEIINQVLEKRFVKKSTIILALMNKDHFVKNSDGTYSLKA